MARTKLTAEARAQIVEGYKQPGVTVSMLAEQFGIGYSTASRVLKEDIPADEYKELVKQKRGGRPSKRKQPAQPSLLDIDSGTDAAQPDDDAPVAEVSDSTLDDSESQTQAVEPELETDESIGDETADGDIDNQNADGDEPDAAEFDEEIDDEFDEDEQLEAELFGDEGDDSDDDEYDSDLDEDDEDDDLDDDDLDDEDLEGDEENSKPRRSKWDEQPSQVEVVGPPPVWYSAVQANPEFSAPAQQEPINIVVLEADDLPGQCFAVVDRFQELTTCPLQEFKHLGDVPNELAEARTLPLFDSHRVARRFSDRFRHRGRHKHRVIGFPGYFLSTTREQLQEKGIAYLLLDNQVYEL